MRGRTHGEQTYPTVPAGSKQPAGFYYLYRFGVNRLYPKGRTSETYVVQVQLLWRE